MHRGGRGQYAPRGGRSPRLAGGRSPHYHATVGADGHSADDSLGGNDGMVRDGRTNPQQRPQGGASKRFEQKPSSGYMYRQKQPAFGANANAGFSNVGRCQPGQSSTIPIGRGSISKPSESNGSVSAREDDHSVFSDQSASKDVHSGSRRVQNGEETGSSTALQPNFSDKIGADGHSLGDSYGSNDGMAQDGRKNPQQRPQGGVSKHFEQKPSSGDMYRQKQPAFGGNSGFSNVVRSQPGQSSTIPIGGVSKPSESIGSVSAREDDPSVFSAQSASKDVRFGSRGVQNGNETGSSVSLHRDFSDKIGADGHSLGDSYGSNDGMAQDGRKNPQQRPQGGVSKHFEQKPSSGYMYRQKQPAFGGNSGFSNVVRSQPGQSSTIPIGGVSKPSESIGSVSASEDDPSVFSAQSASKDVRFGSRGVQNGNETGSSVSLHRDFSDKVKIISQQDESRVHLKSGAEGRVSMNTGPKNSEDNHGDSAGHSKQVEEVNRFDLCPSKGGPSMKLKPSLLERNREKRNEMKRSLEGQNGSILRPGMVLLKSFLSLNDQVKIVKQCRDLGIGTGGFYQPGYGDGRELHLRMMCLGKNWDPETSKYGDSRPHDHATPPKIPDMFNLLVQKAMESSHALIIGKSSKAINVENALPSMSPNICIVNFYTASGRLGLHQDKDESPESLRKGLPVVSFSIGDSAEFLYGDERDVNKAEKVVLESGDLLIFGGKSRHVFHGVTTILSNTAPKALLEETNLRPGRLNLTFREY